MRTIDDFDDLVELVRGAHDDLYVRYSLGPEADAAGESRDYEADVALPGLPVTNLRPEPWWPRPDEDWIARRVCKYLELAEKAPERRAWVLTGRVAGYGPDHEPLVVDVEPVAWLGDKAIDQARERYWRRFDVGRDSTGDARR